MEKQETIADIIAEMRSLSNTTSDGIIAVNGRRVADRLEAAHKREKSAIEADALAVGGMVEAARTTAEKSSAVGDAAKLCEALKRVVESSAEIMERVRYKDGLAFNTANYIAAVARTALAAPPRNCDLPKVVEDPWRAWLDDKSNWEEGYPKLEIHDWLLAPATKTEGGNDGN